MSDETPPTIIVDGTNVSYAGGLLRKPMLQMILDVIGLLEEAKFNVITLIDASMRYTIDDDKGLDTHLRSGKLIQTPAGTSADDFMMQLAQRMQARGEEVMILTNDLISVRRGSGTIRRITLLVVPHRGRFEILFSPSLEYLLRDEDFVEEERTEDIHSNIDPLIFSSFLNHLGSRDPAPKPGDRVPFSSVANYLHNVFHGDFCDRFDYYKPRDFANDLAGNGYVNLLEEGGPIILELKEQLIVEMERFDIGMNGSSRNEADKTADRFCDYLRAIYDELENEYHYPTFDKIAIKFRTLHPDIEIDASDLIDSGMDSGYVVRDMWKNKVIYWPSERTWEAVHPDDETDLYPEELWNDFRQAIYRLPGPEKFAQTRYHIARNIALVDVKSISSLPQAKREHMVQLAVRKNILDTEYTEKGLRITVPLIRLN